MAATSPKTPDHIATTRPWDRERKRDANFLTTFYPENHFSHIIIDECTARWASGRSPHPQPGRGSNWADGHPAPDRRSNPNPEIQQDRDQRQQLPTSANRSMSTANPGHRGWLTWRLRNSERAGQPGRHGISIDDIMARQPVDALTGAPVIREQWRTLTQTQYEDRILCPTGCWRCARIFSTTCSKARPGPEDDHFLRPRPPCRRRCRATEQPVCLLDRRARPAPPGDLRLQVHRRQQRQRPIARPARFVASHFIATTVDLLSTGSTALRAQYRLFQVP